MLSSLGTKRTQLLNGQSHLFPSLFIQSRPCNFNSFTVDADIFIEMRTQASAVLRTTQRCLLQKHTTLSDLRKLEEVSLDYFKKCAFDEDR